MLVRDCCLCVLLPEICLHRTAAPRVTGPDFGQSNGVSAAPGVARAYFSTAPFLGAAAAIVGLGEPITLGLLAAAFLMGIGDWYISLCITSSSTFMERRLMLAAICTTNITGALITTAIHPASLILILMNMVL